MEQFITVLEVRLLEVRFRILEVRFRVLYVFLLQGIGGEIGYKRICLIIIVTAWLSGFI